MDSTDKENVKPREPGDESPPRAPQHPPSPGGRMFTFAMGAPSNSFFGVDLGNVPQPVPEVEEDEDGELTFDWKKAFRKLEDELHNRVQKFFEEFFTYLVYKQSLVPSEYVVMKNHESFEKFPVIRSDETVEYITEVSKTIAHFIRKGVLEGAVFHINVLNKQSCPVTQQRIIFMCRGVFDAEKIDVSQYSRVSKLTRMVDKQLDSIIRTLMEHSLLHMQVPWGTQWGISLGMKKEFVDLTRAAGHLGPFAELNRTSDFFPWRKRPRLSQAIKLGLLDKKKTMESEKRKERVNKLMASRELFADPVRLEKLRAMKEKKKVELMVSMASQKLPEWTYFSSSDESEEDSERPKQKSVANDQPKPKMYIRTIASQEILPKVLLSVYTITYPNIVDEELIALTERDKLTHEMLMKGP